MIMDYSEAMSLPEVPVGEKWYISELKAPFHVALQHPGVDTALVCATSHFLTYTLPVPMSLPISLGGIQNIPTRSKTLFFRTFFEFHVV